MRKSLAIISLLAFIVAAAAVFALAVLADANRQWYTNVQRPHLMYGKWIAYHDGEIKEYNNE